MAVSMQVDIVSAEGQIFSGKAEMLFAQAANGEVGILPFHTQFLSQLKPGEVRVRNNGEDESFFVDSGTLEVQPHVVTILADTCIRSEELDEQHALEAKQRAESAIEGAKSDLDIRRAQVDFMKAVAQLQTIEKLRDRLKKTGMA